MGRQVSMATRKELLEVVRTRYGKSTRAEKGRILDEFVKLTGYHRKHMLRLLLAPADVAEPRQRVARHVYDEAVRQALIVMWEAADRICSKRLRAALPVLMAAMERHGHLELDPEVKARVLRVSAATIDRLLAAVRGESRERSHRRLISQTVVGQAVPVRTHADWKDPALGFFEGDFVLHGGGSTAGSFAHTLVLTEVASGWTDFLALPAREQSLVVAALDVMQARLPMGLKGLDTDNDGAFINETVMAYCAASGIVFTRSRPRHSNDQAWVEQKNGAIVRKLVGYARYEGMTGTQTLERMYRAARDYVNFFQPSAKLLDKMRLGAKVRKRYHPPATPCERLVARVDVPESVKAALMARRDSLDPVTLLKEIRDQQSALACLAGMNLDASDGQVSDTLDHFLAQFPLLWTHGEVRPTHRAKPTPPRTWRTREDPFNEVWPAIERWLTVEPDLVANNLLCRLQDEHPGRFPTGQLRTLQRRVQAWRMAAAKSLLGLTGATTTEPAGRAACPPPRGRTCPVEPARPSDVAAFTELVAL